MAEQLDNPAFGLPDQNVGVAESMPNIEDSLSSLSSNMDNNSKVFWAVNCIIVGMIVLSAIWCCFVQKNFLNDAERRAASDQYYQARLRRRVAREKAKNEEPLDKRQAKLHASFARNNAQMVRYYVFFYRNFFIFGSGNHLEAETTERGTLLEILIFPLFSRFPIFWSMDRL